MGFGSSMNRHTNCDNANDFSVLCKCSFTPCLYNLYTFCSMSVLFLYHMSKTSSLKPLHKIRLDLFMNPIHIALVFFSIFNFSPDIL